MAHWTIVNLSTANVVAEFPTLDEVGQFITDYAKQHGMESITDWSVGDASMRNEPVEGAVLQEAVLNHMAFLEGAND